MSTVQSIYTWSLPQGTLDLMFNKKEYAFCLTTKSQNRIPISCTQDQNRLLLSTQKVEDFCVQYFPTLTHNQRQEWAVTFELSPSPILEQTQQEKSFGAFNFSFNSLDNKKQVQFVKKAPTYCRVISGLNMHGECVNTRCEAVGKTVFIQKGMGAFNIAQLKHKSSCPACNDPIPFDKTNNLGFWNCQYEVEGYRSDKSEETQKKEVAEKEFYTTFKPGEDCAWEYLQVTTTPLQVPVPVSVPVSVPDKPLPQPSNKNSCVLL